MIGEFRSLGRIWSASPERLHHILGSHPEVADLLIAASVACRASLADDLRGIRIDPADAALRRYLIQSMGSLDDEHLRILFLDPARHLIADERLQHGTLARLAVYPRSIFRRALEHNAAAIILVHNHPGGDPVPSREDICVTRELEQIARALDIILLDHIVVSATAAHSVGHVGGNAASKSLFLRAPRRESSGGGEDIALANARLATRRRLLRQQLIGAPELFGDPAWEMLVDLFIHQCERKTLSISDVCVAANIAMSSGLRLVQKLCDAGILRRFADPFDRRRSIIRLEPSTAHRVRAYFEAGC